MFGSIGYPELIVLGIVAVLLFGSRLPQVARSLGQSYRELMRGLNELKSNFDIDDEPDYRPTGLPDYTQPERMTRCRRKTGLTWSQMHRKLSRGMRESPAKSIRRTKSSIENGLWAA